MLVSLLTPTGARPQAFALCERFMERQTYQGEVQWVVVDDGPTPTPITSQRVTTRLRRTPQGSRPRHLLPANLRAAWYGGFLHGDIVLFIEDDDWYPRTWVADAIAALRDDELVGESPYRFYHLPARRWQIRDFGLCSSLSRTGARVEALARMPKHVWEADTPYIDYMIWKCLDIRSRRVISYAPRRGVVGMKGMPGRKGLSPAHDPTEEGYEDDSDLSMLRRWVGDEDAETYAALSRPLTRGGS